jgi:hypothetical protein
MLQVIVGRWTIDLLVGLSRAIPHATGILGGRRAGSVAKRAGAAVCRPVQRQRRGCGIPQLAKLMAIAVAITPGIAAEPSVHCSKPGDIRLQTAYDGGLAQLAETERASWSIFRDPKFGIEFSYRNDRKISTGCRGSKNCIALIAKTPIPGNYVVAFELFKGRLETVAVEQAVFQKEGDHWIAKGRSGRYPVEPISGPGWQGLKSVVDCGISDGGGFHAGAGDCLWVVASNGRRSVVADTPGTAPIDQDTMRSILSLRFTAP